MLEKEYTISPDFIEISDKYFSIFCNLENFANARDVRNICDIIKDVHINRVISIDAEDVNDTITSEDLKQGFEVWNQNVNL